MAEAFFLEGENYVVQCFIREFIEMEITYKKCSNTKKNLNNKIYDFLIYFLILFLLLVYWAFNKNHESLMP